MVSVWMAESHLLSDLIQVVESAAYPADTDVLAGAAGEQVFDVEPAAMRLLTVRASTGERLAIVPETRNPDRQILQCPSCKRTWRIRQLRCAPRVRCLPTALLRSMVDA